MEQQEMMAQEIVRIEREIQEQDWEREQNRAELQNCRNEVSHLQQEVNKTMLLYVGHCHSYL